MLSAVWGASCKQLLIAEWWLTISGSGGHREKAARALSRNEALLRRFAVGAQLLDTVP